MPLLLGLLWLCFLRSAEPAAPQGSRRLDQVALSLLPFVIVSVAFDAYVTAQPWHQPLTTPSIRQVLGLLRVMLVRGMLPPIVGWRVATAPIDAAAVTAIVLGAAALLAGAIFLLIRRELRWSGLAFFLASFLALAATVAVTRANIGPLAGATPRYLCPLPMLLAIAVAGTASGASRRPSTGTPTAEPAVEAAPAWSVGRRGLAAVTTAVLGLGYLIALTTSTNANRFGRVNGQHAHGISDRVSHALHPGMTNLVDTRMRWPVFYTSNDGADEVSTLAPFWGADISAIGQGPNPIGIAPDGSAHRVHFNAGHAGPAQYVQLVVHADRPVRMTVALTGERLLEPNRPFAIDVPAGTSSYILPVWGAHLAGSQVSAPSGLSVVSQQVGTITLAARIPG